MLLSEYTSFMQLVVLILFNDRQTILVLERILPSSSLLQLFVIFGTRAICSFVRVTRQTRLEQI